VHELYCFANSPNAISLEQYDRHVEYEMWRSHQNDSWSTSVFCRNVKYVRLYFTYLFLLLLAHIKIRWGWSWSATISVQTQNTWDPAPDSRMHEGRSDRCCSERPTGSRFCLSISSRGEEQRKKK
jgi:hypothetical protein